jgi:hypothetical protein
MKPALFLTSFALLSALSACYYDNSEELYGTTPCDASAVTWTADIQPMLQTQCVSCHSGASASAGLDLSTYTLVKGSLSTVTGRMNKPMGDPLVMPPSGPLSTCNLTKLDAWVAAGAPEN